MHHVELRPATDPGRMVPRMLDHDEAALRLNRAFGAFDADPLPCANFIEQWRNDPLEMAASLGPWPSDATHVACDECGWVGYVEGADPPFTERGIMEMMAGYLVPAGECPECGVDVYLRYGDWEPPDDG